jgi:ketosteroid isomerase-like protein
LIDAARDTLAADVDAVESSENVMSKENVELARRAGDAVRRGDFDAWMELHDEDFELLPVGDFPIGAVRGRTAAWNVYRDFFDTFKEDPASETEIVEGSEDQVLIHYRSDLHGRRSDVAVEFDYWVVATLRNGTFTRAKWFTEGSEARRVASGGGRRG